MSFKLQVVQEIESGELSIRAARRKYGIQGGNTVTSWVKKYGSFDYFLVNPYYDKQYRDDRRFNMVFGLFTCMSILISVLGLWTLVLFESLIANKNISVRMVFGASHGNLFLGLSKRFLLLIGLSFVMGTPVAYLLMRNWLHQYTFRTDLNWWIFAMAGITTLCITLLTISRQTYKAATRNPVTALSTE